MKMLAALAVLFALNEGLANPLEVKVLSYGIESTSDSCKLGVGTDGVEASLRPIGHDAFYLDYSLPQEGSEFLTVFKNNKRETSLSCPVYALIETNEPVEWLHPTAHFPTFVSDSSKEASGIVKLTVKDKITGVISEVLTGQTHLDRAFGFTKLYSGKSEESPVNCKTLHFLTLQIAYKPFDELPTREFRVIDGPSLSMYASTSRCKD